MDIVLEEALRRERDKAEHHQHEATVSDKLATSLDQRLKRTQREMERELAEKERHVVYLESVSRQRESTIRVWTSQRIKYPHSLVLLCFALVMLRFLYPWSSDNALNYRSPSRAIAHYSFFKLRENSCHPFIRCPGLNPIDIKDA